VAPVANPIPRFAAEPPQESLPYGRWAQRLQEQFLAACAQLQQPPEDLGTPGEIRWYPDRTWHGYTYVPGISITSGGYELFGYVRMLCSADGSEPSEPSAHVDHTDQRAEEHPQWQIDLCDEVIGRWRGRSGKEAAMTLLWGHPLIAGGRVVTAELGELVVDQCELIEERFTLIAPDDYAGDLLKVRLWNAGARQLAEESLYEEDSADSSA
jgi:hypothetical protein